MFSVICLLFIYNFLYIYVALSNPNIFVYCYQDVKKWIYEEFGVTGHHSHYFFNLLIN